MSNPPCLNHDIFLIMNNKIKNAVVKQGIIDGQRWPPFDSYVPCVPCNAIGQNHAVSRGFFLRSLCALLFKIRDPLGSLASFWSLRIPSTTAFSTHPQKTNTKKHKKNTHRLVQPHHSITPIPHPLGERFSHWLVRYSHPKKPQNPKKSPVFPLFLKK